MVNQHLEKHPFRVKITCLLVFLILANQGALAGPRKLNPKNPSEHLLAKALAGLNMDENDLWIPHDAVPRDSFRLPIIDSLFADPLLGFRLPAKLKIENSGSHLLRLKSLTGLLNLNSRSLAGDILKKKNRGLNLTNRQQVDFHKYISRPMSQVIVEALEISFEIKALIKSYQKATLNRLTDQFDSLLLMSDEAENMNVYEIKAAEIRDREKAISLFQDAEKIFIAEFLSRGEKLYQGLLQQIQTGNELFRGSNKIKEFITSEGIIALGTKGEDIYKKDYRLILDPGGNDTYLLKGKTPEEVMKDPFTLILDLGGDDFYRAGDYSLGGSWFGVSLLLDKKGDDKYHGGNFSLGSGFFGMGILHDMAGNDTYYSKVNSQGSGAFGGGFLIDDGGNDVYTCESQCQGFGFTRGVGALLDDSGNDHYITSSPFQDFLRYDNHFVSFSQGAALGYRPIASGGVGVLYDASGKDTYLSDIFGQGTAYWFSYGLLLDNSGSDVYNSYQYSQGAGVHLAHGILWDKKGNDHYNTHGVSQGCGHDIAFGALLDEEGNDVYNAFGLSMGGGNANAISLFMDLNGEDTYTMRTVYNAMGYSDLRRDYGMIGIFADGGGSDHYVDTLSNNRTTLKSSLGVFTDVYKPTVDNKAFQEQVNRTDETVVNLSSTLDSLFIQASAAPQKFRINVAPARDTIIGRGRQAINFLGKKLNTPSARERHALRVIFKGLSKTHPSQVASLVADSVNSIHRRTKLKSADICGRNKIRECIPSLKNLLKEKNANYRAAGALNLGRMQDKKLNKEFTACLKDRHPHVIMRAAWSLGLNLVPADSPELATILDHPLQLVRNGFVQGVLKREEKITLNWVRSALKTVKTTRGKKALVQLVPYAGESKKAAKLFRKIYSVLGAEVKSHLTACIAGSSSVFWKNSLRAIKSE